MWIIGKLNNMACKTCEQEELAKSASLGQIKKAWEVANKANQEAIDLSFSRLAVCQNCEHRKELNPFLQIFQNLLSKEVHQRHVTDIHKCCNLCSCPLVQKSYVNKEENNQGGCPLGKW